MPIGPFPFERLPRVSRAELATRRARRGPLLAIVRGARAIGEWLDLPVRVEAGAPSPPVEPILADTLAILFEDAEGGRAALCLDVGVASVLIDRATGGEGDELEHAGGPLSDLERGVLAYTFARWLAPFGSRFGVATVLTSGAALDAALDRRASLRWPLTVVVGQAIGNAALLVCADAAVDAPRRLPGWARPLPCEVTLVAGEATVSAEVLASLEPGDVIVPEKCTLALEGSALGGRLHLRTLRRSWLLELRPDGALQVLDVMLRPPSRAVEVRVKDPNEALDRIGDAPVTLVLELARITLPLSDLAALAPGAILSTGVPLETRVALRAGERIIAEGELVDVEGELGVRLIELHD